MLVYANDKVPSTSKCCIMIDFILKSVAFIEACHTHGVVKPLFAMCWSTFFSRTIVLQSYHHMLRFTTNTYKTICFTCLFCIMHCNASNWMHGMQFEMYIRHSVLLNNRCLCLLQYERSDIPIYIFKACIMMHTCGDACAAKLWYVTCSFDVDSTYQSLQKNLTILRPRRITLSKKNCNTNHLCGV